MAPTECPTGLPQYDRFSNAARAAWRMAIVHYYIATCNECGRYHIFEIATPQETDPGGRYLSCTSKKTYSTIDFAKKIARNVFAQRGVTLRAYVCTKCGFVHLTRQIDRE